MKKFFTLFALLSVGLSASADDVCIFYEANQNSDVPYLYAWNSTQNNQWPGIAMSEYSTTSEGKKIYKWTANWTPSYIIINGKCGTDQQYKITGNEYDVPFINNAYFIDGAYDHTVGKTGYTIYWDNTETSWWSNVYVYTWLNDKGINSGWTRYKMESLGNNLYSYHVSDEDFNNVIFNNGYSGGSNQSVNVEGAQGGIVYTANGQIGHNDKYNVTAAGPASLTVTDGEDFSCNKDYTTAVASYTRTISDNWGTLCLPFTITKAYEGITFYQLSNVDADRKVLTFTSVSSVEAGLPVIYKAEDVVNLNISEDKVLVSATAKTSETYTGWVLNGSFTRINDYSPTGGTMYFFSDNKFWSGVPAYIPAYRAWFIADVDFGANAAPFRIEEADAEGLQFVEQEDGTVKAYYDLQGRKLDGARKGLVIENGKIIMVK